MQVQTVGPIHYSYRPIQSPKESMVMPLVACDWPALRGQLMLQWNRLKRKDLDKAGPNRRRLAVLIEDEYGIASEMIENYLYHFERTMPLH